MAKGRYANQYFTTVLSVIGGIDSSQTTDIVIQSTTGVQDTSKPGVALLSYADPLNEDTAEWILYDSINSTTKTFVGVTRGAEKGSAKSHSNGVTVAFPLSESHINPLVDAVSIGGSATNIITGVLDEDTMASDSAVKVPTQQSVKKYIDVSTGKSVSTEASSATPTINTDNVGMHTITALATNITSFTTNLSGTPVNGQKLIIRIQDSGSGQTIAWGASFEDAGGTLPTSITAGKKAYVGLIYNSADSKWDCVAAVEEA